MTLFITYLKLVFAELSTTIQRENQIVQVNLPSEETKLQQRAQVRQKGNTMGLKEQRGKTIRPRGRPKGSSTASKGKAIDKMSTMVRALLVTRKFSCEGNFRIFAKLLSSRTFPRAKIKPLRLNNYRAWEFTSKEAIWLDVTGSWPLKTRRLHSINGHFSTSRWRYLVSVAKQKTTLLNDTV